jgi:hypothetical protein
MLKTKAYYLNSSTQTSISSREGAVPLAVAADEGVVVLYMLVDESAPVRQFYFSCFQTDVPIPSDCKYIGTAKIRWGGQHVFQHL